MRFFYLQIAFTGLFGLASFLLSGQIPTFQQTYGGAGYDDAMDVLETPNGYLLAGETFDSISGHTNGLLIQLDKQGAVLWKKTYGQYDDDGFRKVQVANDGGFIAWGSFRDFNNNRTDGWVVKVDASGNLVWQKTISAPGFSCIPYGDILPVPGGYIFSGTKLKVGYSQSFVIRIDNEGNTVWSRFTPSSRYNALTTCYIADSSVYLTGTVNSFGCLRTMNPTTGAITQSHEYQVDTTNWPSYMHRTPDSGHLFTGVVIRELSGLNHYHGWVQKMDAVGQILWSKWYKITPRTWIDASTVLPDGSCVFSMDYNPVLNSPVTYSALVKIDPQGQVVWARHFGGALTIYFQKIIPTADGGLFATGFTWAPAGSNDDRNAFWIKTDSAGIVNGCCVANLDITVEDLAPTERQIPFTATAFEDTAPFQIAEADSARLNVQDICVNVQPIIHPTLAFCPGTTVTLGDSTYGQPGVVDVLLPSTTGGCDTLATYTLEWLPQPVFSDTIAFCPGTTVTLGDSTYGQPGVFDVLLPSTTGGCDTLATYTLEWLPQPVFSDTIAFCPGTTVALGDSTYSQPATVHLVLPSATGGCDTLATYTLVNATTNQASTLQLTCPNDLTVTVPPGASGTVVDYNPPAAVSDCTCPGLTVEVTGGGAIGSVFPIGANTVCYRAEDACGRTQACCFTIQVEADNACDVKSSGCLKFELLTVQRDAAQRWVYRVRVTNQCTAEMTYAYVQVPSSLSAVAPANNSVYAAPGGAEYAVRNPNFSPFYSVRFQPVGAGLVNGQSDVFRYVLPPQASVAYIHVAARLASGAYMEAYLNTFNCPVGTESSNATADRAGVAPGGAWTVYPNPAEAGSMLTVAGPALSEATFLLQDVMGRTVLHRRIVDGQVALERSGLTAGMYFFRIVAGGAVAGSGKVSLF